MGDDRRGGGIGRQEGSSEAPEGSLLRRPGVEAAQLRALQEPGPIIGAGVGAGSGRCERKAIPSMSLVKEIIRLGFDLTVMITYTKLT